MFTKVSEIARATEPVLRAYLKANNVAVGETAERAELEAAVREHFTKQSAAVDPTIPKAPDEEPKAPEVTEDLSIEEALRLLQARGFKDREEVIAYLGVLDREKLDVKNQRAALEATVAEIQNKEIQFDQREKALEERAAEVRADIEKQTTLYTKLEQLRASFPAGVALDV